MPEKKKQELKDRAPIVAAYLRVSTDKQTILNQKSEVINFCHRQELKITMWCTETVSGTKKESERELGTLLKKLQKKYGLTYFFISHNLSVVNYISDRVGVMYLGKIVEMANVDELYGHYHHPYTQALLSAIPSIRTVAGNRIILGGDVPSPTNPPQGCAFHPRCSRCKEKCRTCMPSFRQVEENHWVACHFPL